MGSYTDKLLLGWVTTGEPGAKAHVTAWPDIATACGIPAVAMKFWATEDRPRCKNCLAELRRVIGEPCAPSA